MLSSASLLRRCAAALVLLFGFAASLHAQSGPGTPAAQDVEAIEKIIHNYILEHPELILQAVERYRAKEARAEDERQRGLISSYRDRLENDPNSAIAGNPDGDVTLVEFFDYRCPYCKRVAGYVARLTEEDPNVKIVFKEFPILGPESVLASRAAIASRKQGKYIELHEALMRLKGSFDLDSILQTATEVGLDVVKLQADMGSPKISVIIEQNIALAREIGVDSTPSFIVGGELVKGAVPFDQLKSRVEQGFIPVVSGVPGFVAYYVVSAGDGEVVSINVFEDHVGAEESTRRAADWVMENLATLLPDTPEVTAGEVIVQVQKVR